MYEKWDRFCPPMDFGTSQIANEKARLSVNSAGDAGSSLYNFRSNIGNKPRKCK
jgi:hypothetical protein